MSEMGEMYNVSKLLVECVLIGPIREIGLPTSGVREFRHTFGV